MKQKRREKKGLLLLIICLSVLFCAGYPSAAAEKPATVTECKIISSNTIRITASISDPEKLYGKSCYLFELPMSRNTLSSQDRPVAVKEKGKRISYSLDLNLTKASSRLYSGFLIAQKNANGAYTAVSSAAYISNPQKAAKYTYSFPKTTSKKGLQVSASMQEDAIELNVRHSVLNIDFAVLTASKGERNKKASYSYKYHGKTYWFRKYIVKDYDRQLKALKENNAVVSAILLLSWRNDLKELIYPDGRKKGHAYYAWNTKSASAREQLQAAIAFLAERYSASNGKYGRIVNWIVGNEVNNYKVYNYAGNKSLSEYAAIYAQAFRIVYQTVTSVYANARVYISLDHLWNTNTVSGTFASRKMLDSFAQAIGSYGRIHWNLAYHPYGSPLTEPKFWKNTNGQLTGSLSSPVINMENIGLLTSYVRQKYGSNTRIILSEQGYTSKQAGKNTEKAQAAAIAYSYLLTEADDMIDSFIMNRHVDHDVEVRQGLNLGLWTTKNPNSPEWADKQKYSWNVYKYMDSDRSEQVTSFALKEIGVSDWSEVVSGYGKNLYQKYTAASAQLKTVKRYSKKEGLSSKWTKYGASSKSKKSKSKLRVYHDPARNRNCLWGVTQTFGKPVSFAKASDFFTTVKTSGVRGKKVILKVKFYSGGNILESYGQITANKTVKLGVSLSKWSFRNKVTKIQVLLAPAGSGSWKSKAYFEIKNSVKG